MNYTEKLGLNKPLPEEKYDIEVFNANMDLVDSVIAGLDEKINNADTSAITNEQIDTLFE